jgi:hypothetical protein
MYLQVINRIRTHHSDGEPILPINRTPTFLYPYTVTQQDANLVAGMRSEWLAILIKKYGRAKERRGNR